jgi:hypothetical protein
VRSFCTDKDCASPFFIPHCRIDPRPGNIYRATSVKQDETQDHDSCSRGRFSAVLHAVTGHPGRQRRAAGALIGHAISAEQRCWVLHQRHTLV